MENFIDIIDRIIDENFINKNYNKNEAILLLGPPNSGKTTYINKNIDKNKYMIIDAGEYYKKLNNNSSLGFNDNFIEELNYIGTSILEKLLKNNYSFVIEFQLDNYKDIILINKKLKELSYNVIGLHLDCTKEESIERNEKRNNLNISSYFSENYHIAWFKNILNLK